MKALIVSRHNSTIELLKSILEQAKIEYDVVEHIDVYNSSILNKYELVIGNIPLSMWILSNSIAIILVSLELPKHLRGKELSDEQLRKRVNFVFIEKNGKLQGEIEKYSVGFPVMSTIMMIKREKIVDFLKLLKKYY